MIPTITISTEQQSIQPENQKLAEKLIKARSDNKYVKKICSSEDFVTDPTSHLFKLMVEEKGSGGNRLKNEARTYIIINIPNFIENISCPGYLENFATNYFKGKSNFNQIMDIFRKTISQKYFQEGFRFVIDRFKSANSFEAYYLAEGHLRDSLMIFAQVAVLQNHYSNFGHSEE